MNYLANIKLNLDVNSFLIEIDNEMDAMQATILQLQERLNSYSNLNKIEPDTNDSKSMETQGAD